MAYSSFFGLLKGVGAIVAPYITGVLITTLMETFEISGTSKDIITWVMPVILFLSAYVILRTLKTGLLLKITLSVLCLVLNVYFWTSIYLIHESLTQ